MMKNLTYSNLLVYVLGLVAFVQVAIPSMISIGIALFFLVFVKGLISKELKFKFHIVYLLFSLFYLAYVIGVFYTNNNAIAFQYLEYKLSFLLFPILFSFVPKDPLAYDKIVFGFVLGVVVVIVYGFIHGFFCYLNGGEACFVTTSISPIHHPSYFDAYIIFALFASLIGIINKWKMSALTLQHLTDDFTHNTTSTPSTGNCMSPSPPPETSLCLHLLPSGVIICTHSHVTSSFRSWCCRVRCIV